ncbi:MAG: DNA gyrase C-terminal beta-propeller domain-containing protein [Pyrinomonadaceae bacterium]
MGRAARGVRGMDLRKDDFVVSVCPVSADDSEKMLSISRAGAMERSANQDQPITACSREAAKA